jgi:asparagine synthase (glutamine-hydrolysing)
MCGIFAVLSRERPNAQALAIRGVSALVARGPDGEGVFVGEGGRVALAHRRLAVMDVEGGRQPLLGEDGRVALVVNGELYATASLRRELVDRGHQFRTRSDSEVLLHLYEERGLEAVHALRGELAFVLWDEANQRLVAGRDRFGVKPLCWATHDGALLVASQAKALFAAGVPARWDHDSVFQALSMQYPLPGRTLFDGVRSLPPGHLLVAEGGRLDVRRWWDLDLPASPRAIDDREAIERLRSSFDDAVRTRLVADVPIAFQLSGGLDSTAVAAVAASSRTEPIDCFTVAFDAGGYDELPIARETCAFLGARAHVVPVSDVTIERELSSAIVAGEGISINGHIVGKYLLGRAVRDAGFKVVLTGEGADEVLAGYAHLRADLRGDVRTVEGNAASRGIMLPQGDGLPLHAVRARLGFVPTWLAAKATLGKRLHALASDAWMTTRAGDDAYARFLESIDVAGQLQGREPVEQSTYLWAKTALEGYILRTLGDGMEMAHSVEGRLPFLDHELFTLLRAMPITLKIRDGIEKWPLREAMKGRIPESVRTREKHPFLAPPFFAESPRLVEQLRDLLRARHAQQLPFLDGARIDALLDRLPTMSAAEHTAVDPVLFVAFSLHTLHARLSLSI